MSETTSCLEDSTPDFSGGKCFFVLPLSYSQKTLDFSGSQSALDNNGGNAKRRLFTGNDKAEVCLGIKLDRNYFVSA